MCIRDREAGAHAADALALNVARMGVLLVLAAHDALQADRLVDMVGGEPAIGAEPQDLGGVEPGE
eukprot:4320507-Alexandrium_andersonii.AAC.1